MHFMALAFHGSVGMAHECTGVFGESADSMDAASRLP